jgi:hypothetical protein
MKIYQLDYSVNTGVYPQCKKDDNYDYGKYFYMNDRYFGLSYDLFPKPDEVKLHFLFRKKARVTDIMSQAGITAFGHFMNERLKNVLEQFRICPHIFYPATLRYEEEAEIRQGYYWLHLDGTHMRDLINYQASKFYVYLSSPRAIISLNSYQDYIDKKKVENIGWTIYAEEIHLKPNVVLPYDMFVFGWGIDLKIYITENLKKALIKHKIKGINLEEATHIIIPN